MVGEVLEGGLVPLAVSPKEAGKKVGEYSEGPGKLATPVVRGAESPMLPMRWSRAGFGDKLCTACTFTNGNQPFFSKVAKVTLDARFSGKRVPVCVHFSCL